MDISYLLFLQNLRELTGDFFTKFFVATTEFGEFATLGLIFMAIYWSIDKKFGEQLLITYGSGRLVNAAAKTLICVYRPWVRDARVRPVEEALEKASGYSFPSGHTMNAVTTFGGLSMKKELTKAFRIFLWICPVIIGFSRNYVGVHTPQDVVIGFLLSAGLVIGTAKLFDWMGKNEKRDIPVAVVLLVLCAVAALFVRFRSYPMDYDEAGKLIVDPAKMALDAYKSIGYTLGITLGWILERRLVHFSSDGDVSTRLFRFCGGYLGYMLVANVLNPVLKAHMSAVPAGILGSFTQMFYIMFAAPLAMKLIADRKAKKTQVI